MQTYRTLFLLIATLLAAPSCVRLDHAPDLQQASAAVERATGAPVQWTPDAPLRPLTPPADGILSLDQAVLLALANNRALRADLLVIAQARADLVQAGLLSNPVFSFSGMFPEGGGRVDLTFGLGKDFAELWLIPSRKQAARAMLQERILSACDAAIALANDVKTNYYMLQYQLQAIVLEEENLRILSDMLDISDARLRAGAGNQLDIYLTRGRYLETELDLLQLRADAQIARATLLRLMGVARDTTPWDPARPDPRPPAVAADDDTLIESGLQQRLDLQAAEYEFDGALADVEQQRRRLLPSLNLGVGGRRFESRGLPDRKILADTARASAAAGRLTAPGIQSRAERKRERSARIDIELGPMLEIPVPIFDQNQAQVARAQARARELRQRYEDMEQRIIESIRIALTRCRLADARLGLVRDSLLPQWESNLRVARQTYQTGGASILSVLLAQETLIRTRLSLLASVRDLLMARAGLEREMSGRIPDALLRPATAPAPAASAPAGAATSPADSPQGPSP